MKKDINLVTSALEVNNTVVVGGVPTKADKSRDLKVDLKKLGNPTIPFVFNEAAIGKHTELVMLSDPVLKNLETKIAKEKAARDLNCEIALKRQRDTDAKKDSAVLAQAAAAMGKRHKR